jgi:hypothetical protein
MDIAGIMARSVACKRQEALATGSVPVCALNHNIPVDVQRIAKERIAYITKILPERFFDDID